MSTGSEGRLGGPGGTRSASDSGTEVVVGWNVCTGVGAAAGVVVGSGKVVGVTKAMEIVGFTAEQRREMRL